VQEFYVGSLPHLHGSLCLLNGRHVAAYLVSATSRGHNDIVEASEIAHKEFLSRFRFHMAAGIDHRLATAGLIDRILRVESESTQQLKSRDANPVCERAVLQWLVAWS
jgi:hypothetical protein